MSNRTHMSSVKMPKIYTRYIETQMVDDSSSESGTSTELDFKTYDELLRENEIMLEKMKQIERERQIEKLEIIKLKNDNSDLKEHNDWLFETIQNIITTNWRNYK